jgi:transcriptional regulator with XRE-family HTH domain
MSKRLRTPATLPTPSERRRLRLHGGLSGAYLASQVGVAPATVYGWEMGREPSGLLREAYAAALMQLAESSESETADDAGTTPDNHRSL